MVPLPLIKDTRFVSACPISSKYKFHAYSGSGLQFLAHSLIDGRTKASEEMAEIAFSCRTCGYCDVACKSIMDAERTQVIQTMREHLVEEGFAPKSNQEAIENFRRHGHVEGDVLSPLVGWAKANGIKVLPAEKAEVLLYAGSELKGDANYFEVVKKFAKLLKAAKIDFGVLDDEPCSGIHAYWMAYREDFVAAARKTADKIASAGVKTVVTASGTSLGMLRAKYNDYGIDLGTVQIAHATEVLKDLLQAGKLKLSKRVSVKATYHDPCFLGRQSERTEQWQGESRVAFGQVRYEVPPKPIRYGSKGVYDAPRDVIHAIPGIEFVEMPRIKEHALCCGYGGGANKEYRELTEATGNERLQEAESVNADVLVTACGFCERHFRATQKAPEGGNAGKPAMRVVDIIDLVFEASGIE
jgi:Fe-S oxidoreductase